MQTLSQLKENIPSFIYQTADILIDAGYEAYLVGGAVRDILLGRRPKDFDLATNALPEEIMELYSKTVNTNAKFGTILVIMTDDKGENFDVEITTYRKEEEYIKGRWPSKVEFTSEIEEDLSRRDFTINAIAINFEDIYESSASLEEVIFDPFSGQADLEQAKIRAVRDPEERFLEDGLRAYKACRLASELEFEIEPATFQAIKNNLEIASQISMERIRDEFIKLLKYSPKPSLGINLLKDSGLLELFMPELLELVGLEQPEWHTDDVYAHSLKTLDLAEDRIRLAALLHDLGKARTRSEDEKGIHFYGHDKVGSEMAEEIMKRLRFSKSEIARVKSLIRWHMFYYPSAEWRTENQLSELELEQKKSGGWSDAAIRRFIKNVGGEELIDDLFRLRIADATANPKTEFDPLEIEALESRIAEVRQQDMALKVTDLAITGHDLQELGVEAGPKIGETLEKLLDQVIETPELNTKEQLIEKAKELIY